MNETIYDANVAAGLAAFFFMLAIIFIERAIHWYRRWRSLLEVVRHAMKGDDAVFNALSDLPVADARAIGSANGREHDNRRAALEALLNRNE